MNREFPYGVTKSLLKRAKISEMSSEISWPVDRGVGWGGDTKKKISLRNFRSDLGLWTSQWLHHVSDSGYVSQDTPTIIPVLHDSLPTGTDTVSELLHPPSPKAPDSAPSSWVIVLNTHCLVLAFTDYVCSSICASDHKTRSSKTQQDSVSVQSVVTKKMLW